MRKKKQDEQLAEYDRRWPREWYYEQMADIEKKRAYLKARKKYMDALRRERKRRIES